MEHTKDKTSYLVIDIETTGLDVFKDRILCVGVKYNDEPARCYTDREEFRIYVGTIFNPVSIIGHNITFDVKFLMRSGYLEADNCQYVDTKILAFYNNPHESHKLDDLAKKYLGKQKLTTVKELLGKGKNKIRMEDVDKELLQEYCKTDVDLTWELFNLWNK